MCFVLMTNYFIFETSMTFAHDLYDINLDEKLGLLKVIYSALSEIF